MGFLLTTRYYKLCVNNEFVSEKLHAINIENTINKSVSHPLVIASFREYTASTS